MSFAAPGMLWGLLLIPLAVAFYVWSQRRRLRYAVRFTNLNLLANLVPRTPAWRRHVPPALYLAAIAGLLLALARPSMVVPVPREEATVILAMDTSASMRATDVDPTRLDAAKAAARAFVKQLPKGFRVGIVAFSSQPVTLVTPTTDRAAVEEAIDGLRADGGTAMGDALMRVVDLAQKVRQEAAGASPSPSPGSSAAPGASAPGATPAPGASSAPGASPAPSDQPQLAAGILLSDGANSTGIADPLEAADRAAELKVPLYTIALGTPDGEVEVTDRLGRQVVVRVPPDPATLAEIASRTGAAAFDAPTAEQLRAVYDNLQSRIGFVPEEREVTDLFAGAGLVLVAAGAMLAALWFGRLP
jgi:Ca-activated chloride channel family protein